MNFTKKTIKDTELKGKKVLLRAMLNVPIKDGVVTDMARLEAAKPTIEYLLKHKASIILVSHHSTSGQSLEPVSKALTDMLEHPVRFIDDCIGSKVDRAVQALKPLDIVMLENLRFHPEEEANDDDFAKTLAGYADIFVQDDFTTCHREHASMVGVPRHLPAVAGLQVETEVATISDVLENPKRPLIAVTGGAKVSTKIPILSFLLDTVDDVFIGGAMANTFLFALGKSVGKSSIETDQVEKAKEILAKASEHGKTVLLPQDVVVTTNLDDLQDIRTISVDEVGEHDIIADLGPQTIDQIDSIIKPEGSIIWNGPAGIFETPAFAEGTNRLADKIANSGAYTLVGGGDTLAFVDSTGLRDKFSFVSTGGGASLELMSGKSLPGVEVLQAKDA